MLAAMTCWKEASDGLAMEKMLSATSLPKTMVKATEARGTVLDSVINRIALSAYNGHPEVLAHDHNDSGAGSIALDGRKKQGVRNWMERTSANAFVEVLRSTHDSVVMLVFGGGRISEPSSPI